MKRYIKNSWSSDLYPMDVTTENEIKKAIQHGIDSGADYTDIDDYLNRLHTKGTINDEEFSTLINWAATKMPELL